MKAVLNVLASRFRIHALVNIIGMFGVVVILAVGRFYDARLGDISYIITLLYLISIVILLAQNNLVFNRQVVGFILFLGILLALTIGDVILGYTSTSNIPYALEKIQTLGLISIPVVFLAGTIHDREVVISFCHLLGWFGILLASFGIIATQLDIVTTDRLAVLGGGPIVFARWASVGLIYSALVLKSNVVIKSTLTVICSLAVLLAGSKGPLLSLLLVFIYFLVLSVGKNGHVFKRFGVVIVTLGILVGIFSTLPESPAKRRFQQSVSFSEATSLASIQSRLRLLHYSAIATREHPTGVGNAQFSDEMNEMGLLVRADYYPHNLTLELGVEQGLLVAFAFLFFLLVGLRNAFNNRTRTDRFLQFIGALFIFYLINAHLSGDLSDARFLFIAMAFLFRADSNPRR